METPKYALNPTGIDTSSWSEFGDFFTAAKVNKHLWHQYNDLKHDEFVRRLAPCSFFSAVTDDLEKGADVLRQNLLKLFRDTSLKFHGFLALPGYIELTSKPSLIAQYGEIPGWARDVSAQLSEKRLFAVYCFAHISQEAARERASLRVAMPGAEIHEQMAAYLEELYHYYQGLGIDIAVQEGQVGKVIP